MSAVGEHEGERRSLRLVGLAQRGRGLAEPLRSVAE
jgi:hypothetical protein